MRLPRWKRGAAGVSLRGWVEQGHSTEIQRGTFPYRISCFGKPSYAKSPGAQAGPLSPILIRCLHHKLFNPRDLSGLHGFFAVFSGMSCGQDATGIMASGAPRALKGMSSGTADEGVAL